MEGLGCIRSCRKRQDSLSYGVHMHVVWRGGRGGGFCLRGRGSGGPENRYLSCGMSAARVFSCLQRAATRGVWEACFGASRRMLRCALL